MEVVDGVTERWLSSSKHLVLLQRTWDQILRTHIPPDVVATSVIPALLGEDRQESLRNLKNQLAQYTATNYRVEVEGRHL